MTTAALPAPRDLTYEPIDTVHAAGHAQRRKPIRSAIRAECPTCGVLKSAGQIVTHAPTGGTWSVRYRCLILHRSIYCAGCRHVVHWVERCTETGQPTGEVLGSPNYYSGEAYIAKYLAEHPEALEVEQI
ncbi:MAG: hypothetical protein AAGA29_05780 [Planctomycetota bacterium]